MKWVLSSLLLVLMGMQTFSIDGSLATGLSVKNAMIYSSALLVILHYVVTRDFRVQLPGLQGAFVFTILYALLSWLILAFAVQHPGYNVLGGAISLKSELVDQLIMFMVFFYGVRTRRESNSVLDAFLVGVFVANVVSLLDASGVLGWNVVNLRTEADSEYGRVQGAFGDANEYAALNAMVIPAYVAKCLTTTGYRRGIWGLAVGFAFAAVIMAASRGAMLAIIVSAATGVVVFRQYISLTRVVAVGAGAAMLAVAVALALTDTYAELARERFLGLTFSGDLHTASSGRNEVWGTTLRQMAESPWSIASGFGWGASSALEWDPHNEYLDRWYNLGLPGLVAFLFMFGQVLSTLRTAAYKCAANRRPFLIALWFGFFAFCVTIFFVGFTTLPWLYVWAFAGLACRFALSPEREASAVAGVSVARSSAGWRGEDSASGESRGSARFARRVRQAGAVGSRAETVKPPPR